MQENRVLGKWGKEEKAASKGCVCSPDNHCGYQKITPLRKFWRWSRTEASELSHPGSEGAGVLTCLLARVIGGRLLGQHVGGVACRGSLKQVCRQMKAEADSWGLATGHRSVRRLGCVWYHSHWRLVTGSAETRTPVAWPTRISLCHVVLSSGTVNGLDSPDLRRLLLRLLPARAALPIHGSPSRSEPREGMSGPHCPLQASATQPSMPRLANLVQRPWHASSQIWGPVPGLRGSLTKIAIQRHTWAEERIVTSQKARKKKSKFLSPSSRTKRAREGTGDLEPGSGTKSANKKHPLWFTEAMSLDWTQTPQAGQLWAVRTCSGMTQSPGRKRSRPRGPTNVISRLLKACLAPTARRLGEEKEIIQETCEDFFLFVSWWWGETERETQKTSKAQNKDNPDRLDTDP